MLRQENVRETERATQLKSGSNVYPNADTNTSAPNLKKSSGFAKASFIIAMVGIAAWLVIFISALTVSRGTGDTEPIMMIVGFLTLAGLAMNLAGAIFGIIVIRKNIAGKWMATTGIIFNGIEFVGVLYILIVGFGQQ